jgi:anti-sigma factor RsiW
MREASRNAMSCRAMREELNNALAAGRANAVEREISSHFRTCGGCREYYDAQIKLYEALDSGVRKLVENTAPPALLPGVRERLAEADPQPNRAWVRALVPSTVALLIASGLLLRIPGYVHKAEGARTASVVPTPQRNTDSVAHQSNELGSLEASAMISNSHPAKSRRISSKPERPELTAVAVILDPRETEAFTAMTKEIARNPELGFGRLGRVPSTADQAETIEPLKIAEINIPAIAEKKE